MDFIYWAKNLLIFRAVYWVIRNLWWVFILIIFWPQIEDYLENFSLWWDLKWAFADFMRELESWQIWHSLMDGMHSIASFFKGLFITIRDAIAGSNITLEESVQIVGEKAANIVDKI